jgi:hypothetical protein
MKSISLNPMIVLIVCALVVGSCNFPGSTSGEVGSNIMVPDEFARPDDQPDFDPCESPEAPIIHVPEEVGSISGAIDKIGEHGRVIVDSNEYADNIEIKPGSHIILQASENSERPTLFASDPDRPVILISQNARLCLDGFSLHGGRSGLVAGSQELEGAAHSIKLSNVHVADAEYGIYGLVETIQIEDSSIENNVNGLTIAGTAYLSNTTIAGNSFGMLISGENKPTCTEAAYNDNSKNVFIQKVNVSNNQSGGIAICNVSSATIKDTYVHKNGYIGVQVHNTPQFYFTNLRVGETQLLNGAWGDGLAVVHSSGQVLNSQFSANKRANIIYYGNSGGKIENNLIIYAVFAIVLEGKDGVSPNPDIKNNYLFGNQNNQVSFGQNLNPPPSPSVPSL